LFQNYPLVEWLTASENAKLFATEPEKAEECLAKLGLTKQRNRYVNKLSFGQRQRVAIAQTLLSNNRILLMDEPTSAVDQDNKISVMELIQASAQEQQRLILIATHDPELIDFADWMVNVNRYELEKRKVR
ncbi:MAG: ATP-binding cassette domain-containing protein, partial [Bacillota bacterium]|nr:ATP-binding cassette domain-containing protein [Bacillota bacterium]